MRYSNLKEDAAVALQYDAVALSAIAPIYSGFIPWSESSLRPAAIRLILNDIYLNRRINVVEFGAGVSTLFIAHMLARQGHGRAISVDHDLSWIQAVEAWLPEHCRERVTFAHAALTQQSYRGDSVEWYDPVSITSVVGERSGFDLMLVDGPPAYMRARCMNRGPAAAFMRNRLAPSSTIILDDIDRTGEQLIAGDWSTLLGCDHRNLKVEAGVALWQRGEHRNIG